MLFGGGEDKHCVFRRLFKSFQEGVECLGRKHVHLVDDKHSVAGRRGRSHLHLLYQIADSVDSIVGGGIKLKDIERGVGVELLAGVALVARLPLGREVLAVDGLGKYARTSGLANSAASAEQVRMGKFAARHCMSQRGCERILSHHRRKGRRAIFSGRYDKF